MSTPGAAPKILLIDSNVYFSKRLTDALKNEGFEVTASTQSVYALTMLNGIRRRRFYAPRICANWTR